MKHNEYKGNLGHNSREVNYNRKFLKQKTSTYLDEVVANEGEYICL